MKAHEQKSIDEFIENLNGDVYSKGIIPNDFPKNRSKGSFSLLNQLAFIAVIVALIVLAMSFSVRAQAIPVTGYGSADELRGVKSLSVETGADEKSRAAIVREISRRLPHLHITTDDTDEETNVALVYRTEAVQKKNDFLFAPQVVSRIAPHGFDKTNYPFAERLETIPQTLDFTTGIGYVVKTDETEQTGRILMIYESDRLQGSFERDPAVKFARAFVKTYLKANDRSNIRW